MLTETMRQLITTMEIVKNRTAIEAFDYILFDGENAVAFNGTVGIVAKCEVDEPFTAPMVEFAKIVKACSAENIDITVADNSVFIKCGRLKAELVTEYNPESEFEAIGNIEEVKMKKLPEGFIEALEMCARTSSNSVTMDVLNSVFVNNKDIVGSDDARLTVVKLNKSAGKYILPYASVRDVVKFSPSKFGTRDGWAFFTDDEDKIMAVRTVSDTYPAYASLFDVETQDIHIPAAATELILSASIFSTRGTDEEEYSEAVDITVKKGGILVKSKNHRGNLTNSVKCKTKAPRDITLSANPKMFVDALALSEGIIGVGEDRIVIKSEKVQHVSGLQEQ